MAPVFRDRELFGKSSNTNFGIGNTPWDRSQGYHWGPGVYDGQVFDTHNSMTGHPVATINGKPEKEPWVGNPFYFEHAHVADPTAGAHNGSSTNPRLPPYPGDKPSGAINWSHIMQGAIDKGYIPHPSGPGSPNGYVGPGGGSSYAALKAQLDSQYAQQHQKILDDYLGGQNAINTANVNLQSALAALGADTSKQSKKVGAQMRADLAGLLAQHDAATNLTAADLQRQGFMNPAMGALFAGDHAALAGQGHAASDYQSRMADIMAQELAGRQATGEQMHAGALGTLANNRAQLLAQLDAQQAQALASARSGGGRRGGGSGSSGGSGGSDAGALAAGKNYASNVGYFNGGDQALNPYNFRLQGSALDQFHTWSPEHQNNFNTWVNGTAAPMLAAGASTADVLAAASKNPNIAPFTRGSQLLQAWMSPYQQRDQTGRLRAGFGRGYGK